LKSRDRDDFADGQHTLTTDANKVNVKRNA